MKLIIFIFLIIYIEGFITRKPCYPPEKWQSSFYSVQLYNNFINKSSYGMVYYNYPSQKIRVDYIVHMGNNDDESHIKGTVFYLFDKSIGFNYNRINNTCKPFRIYGDMPPPKIPSSASFLSQFMIGSQEMEIWEILKKDFEPHFFKEEKKHWKGLITVTENTCFPASINVYNTSSHQLKYLQSFWNVIPIVPFFTFEIPSLCQNTLVVKEFIKLEEEDISPFGPDFIYNVY